MIMTTHTVDQILEALNRIEPRRGDCWSCQRASMDNHDWSCTHGPDCTETPEKMSKRAMIGQHWGRRAIEAIKAMQTEITELKVSNAKGDGI